MDILPGRADNDNALIPHGLGKVESLLVLLSGVNVIQRRRRLSPARSWQSKLRPRLCFGRRKILLKPRRCHHVAKDQVSDALALFDITRVMHSADEPVVCVVIIQVKHFLLDVFFVDLAHS